MDPSYAPGWYPDPARRYEYRYHNGQRWTADVSVNGQRYVDPHWVTFTTPDTPQGPAAPYGAGTFRAGPSRAMAITAFVVGLSALLLAWVPFVFVLAAAGAIVGAVFGIIALRANAAGTATGKAFAVWGLVLSLLAAPLCIVGFLISREVLREIDDLLDPGPYSVSIERCDVDDGVLVIAGTITNLDDRYHDYTIRLSYTVEVSGNISLGRDYDTVYADTVGPGEKAPFTTSSTTAGSTAECAVDSVNGFTP